MYPNFNRAREPHQSSEVCVLPHWAEGLRLVNDSTVSISTMTFESNLIPLEVTDRNP